MIGPKRKKSLARITPDESVTTTVEEPTFSSWYPAWSPTTDEAETTKPIPFTQPDPLTPKDQTEWELIQAVQTALTNIDDTLDSMLADGSDAFKPFVQNKVFEESVLLKEGVKSEKGKKVKGNLELTSNQPDFTLMMSILNDPKNVPCLHASKSKLTEMIGSISLSLKILKLRILAFKRFKAEIESWLQYASKRFPKSVVPAQQLTKNYSQFGRLRLNPSSYQSNTSNVLYYSDTLKEYSVVYRSSDVDCFKIFEIKSSQQRKGVLEQILSEMSTSLGLVHSVLKSSLNRIYEGQNPRCIKLELVTIHQLLKSPLTQSLPVYTTTTILFSLMRILPKVEIIRGLLKLGSDHLTETRDRLVEKIKKCEKVKGNFKAGEEDEEKIETPDEPLSLGEKLVKYFDSQSLPLPMSPDLYPTPTNFEARADPPKN